MIPKPLIVDGHLDLVWNMRTFGRDYTRPVAETRRLEQNSSTPGRNGDSLLGWAEFQRGRVGVIFAALFAAPAKCRDGDWDTQCYTDISQANRLYREQVEDYYRLVDQYPEKFRLVLTQDDLQETLSCWEGQPMGGEADPEPCPVGLVMLMENAEGVRAPGELEEWSDMGVRIIGPAWVGTRFCGGTNEPGPLTPEGFALLDGMAALNFGLDLAHMDERAALQALDHYPGTLLATHGSAATLLKSDSNRAYTDAVIEGLIERDGVVGITPANGFLRADWRAAGGRANVGLEHVFAQIDYVCQMAGDAAHVAIGSDYDGGFGLQSVPAEIDTIADLQKLVSFLLERGYTGNDVAAVMGGNWLSALRKILP
ncbi:MAG: membrane dipeptidase [Anaerolineales bacterium]|nr:membrane dipeptidase [Anaerolineales bacterium]